MISQLRLLFIVLIVALMVNLSTQVIQVKLLFSRYIESLAYIYCSSLYCFIIFCSVLLLDKAANPMEVGETVAVGTVINGKATAMAFASEKDKTIWCTMIPDIIVCI